MPQTEPNLGESNRHADFEKIHRAFLAHYAQNPQLGESRYAEWLQALSLDDTKPYCKPQERFQWAKDLIQQVREDQDAVYYKVEALFPLESMNGNPYTREELLQATRTLTGKPNNLNHETKQGLPEIQILAAQYEDDTAECFVRILKTSAIPGMIERKEIVNVSIEGDWSHGVTGKGLVFEGLAWLTKDVLPGVPLTRIEPVEKIAESFNKQSPANATVVEKLTAVEKELDEKKVLLTETQHKLENVQTTQNETANKLTEAQKIIEDLRKQVPGGGLLKDPPKMIPVAEAIRLVESVLPSLGVQRSWRLGPQRLCQELRRVVLQLRQLAGTA